MLTGPCGLKRGDRVLVILPRVPEWWLLSLGCIRAGYEYILLYWCQASDWIRAIGQSLVVGQSLVGISQRLIVFVLDFTLVCCSCQCIAWH